MWPILNNVSATGFWFFVLLNNTRVPRYCFIAKKKINFFIFIYMYLVPTRVGKILIKFCLHLTHLAPDHHARMPGMAEYSVPVY